MNHLEEVKHLRTEPDGRHYNCAQSLLVPYAPEFGLTPEEADKLGAFFGSGMLHGSTCGALSATLMLMGLAGCTSQQAGEVIRDFRKRHQTSDCTTLLSMAKEQGISRKAHCDGLVMEMAQVLEEVLAQKD